MCVWANKSQTNKNKQTNKLATEIGNSRMPYSPSLWQAINSQTIEEEDKGDEAEETKVGYGQCVFECNIHHIHIHTYTNV